MASYVRLYLVPVAGQAQQVIDVDSELLIQSNGQFVYPQNAASVTLTQAPVDSTFEPFVSSATPVAFANSFSREVRVCWREPVDTEQYPNEEVITETDPSGGVCVCGITCDGVDLSYAVVQNVAN
jgi:hypothetical protein